MPHEDFIKLPNGKKIFLKDSYGKVSIDEMPKRSSLRSIFSAFNHIPDAKLNSKETSSIFNTLKEFAAQDGNNELSYTELENFIKQTCPENFYGTIKPDDMLKFLELVQKKSDESLKNVHKSQIHPENSLEKFFPELSFLDLGVDNNIDAQKLSFEEIKKHFPDEKYEIVMDLPSPDDAGMLTAKETLRIINKVTQTEVLSFENSADSSISIEVFDEKTGKNFLIYAHDDDIDIRDDNYNYISIEDGKVSDLALGDEIYFFDEGILETIMSKNSVKTIENGIVVKEKTIHQISESKHTDISEKLAKFFDSENSNPEEFAKLIENSVKNNTIGNDMDDYFAKTGRELMDDIQNSKIPEKLKQELLNSICEPYIDSNYYDAHKKVNSSRISNEYYRSKNEYSIEYNGPIVNVFNKTTGESRRINLKSLINIEYRSKNAQKRSLKTLQELPGEVFENMAAEIRQIRGMKKEEQYSETDKIKAAAFYSQDTITAPYLRPGTLIHELAHGIDNIKEKESVIFQSEKGKFKEIYDKCIQKLENSGRKTFDNQNPMKGNFKGIFGGATNYATYNEAEAFAVCMQILMGAENTDTKFVKKYMPELIEAAKELYLETRQKPESERRAF